MAWRERIQGVIEVLNPSDQQRPDLALQVQDQVSGSLALSGSVIDVNLDYWSLEISRAGEEDYVELARGESSVNSQTLFTIDPGTSSQPAITTCGFPRKTSAIDRTQW